MKLDRSTYLLVFLLGCLLALAFPLPGSALLLFATWVAIARNGINMVIMLIVLQLIIFHILR